MSKTSMRGYFYFIESERRLVKRLVTLERDSLARDLAESVAHGSPFSVRDRALDIGTLQTVLDKLTTDAECQQEREASENWGAEHVKQPATTNA